MTNFIQNDYSKRQLVKKYELQKILYKYIIKNQRIQKKIRYMYIHKLNKLKKNSLQIKIQNRCVLSGRSKAVYKLLKISRIKFRELAFIGALPGITKASW